MGSIFGSGIRKILTQTNIIYTSFGDAEPGHVLAQIVNASLKPMQLFGIRTRITKVQHE